MIDTQSLSIGNYDDVTVDYEWTIENDGIGSYEFWGFKGFDRGVDMMVIHSIEPRFTDETREEREEILSELNHNWEKYADLLHDRHEWED